VQSPAWFEIESPLVLPSPFSVSYPSPILPASTEKMVSAEGIHNET